MSVSDKRQHGEDRFPVAHVTTADMSLRYLLLNQMRSLAQDGYEVSGISSAGPDVPEVEAAGIRHVPVQMARNPYTPFRDLVTLLKLFFHFRREKYLIIHTHTPKPGLLGPIAARMAGVPIVVSTVHGYHFHEHMPARQRRMHMAMERVSTRFSDLVLCQSHEDLETAKREKIGGAEKLRYLGNGIDLSQFDPLRVSEGARAEKRAELGIPPDAALIGFVGRLVEMKGLREIFAAAQVVRAEIPNVHFLLVGPPDTEKKDSISPADAEEAGVADICTFLGMRDDMPELYTAMDVFILPSYREGFPRSAMEASAMGVPCIVTDVRGCREAVEHDRNGLIVPMGDADALAKAILELLGDTDRARRLGETGRRMARERFDEQPVFETVKSEYARLLRAKGLAAPDRSDVSAGGSA